MGCPGQVPSTRLLALNDWNQYQVLADRFPARKRFVHASGFKGLTSNASWMLEA